MKYIQNDSFKFRFSNKVIEFDHVTFLESISSEDGVLRKYFKCRRRLAVQTLGIGIFLGPIINLMMFLHSKICRVWESLTKNLL